MSADGAVALSQEDYAALYQLLLSGDPQGSALAKKLTPSEQQAFFDYQQQANRGKGELTRVDNSVGGLPPEVAVATAVPVARAIAGTGAAGLSLAGRAAAGVKAATVQAAPALKYELTKSALTQIGMPPAVAIPIALAVSGYHHPEKKAATVATAESAASVGGLSGAEEAALAKQGYSPQTIAKIKSAATAETAAARPPASVPVAPAAPAPQSAPPPSTPAAQQLAQMPGALTDEEARAVDALVKQGYPREDVLAAVQQHRAVPSPPAPAATAGRLKLTSAEYREYARMKTAGKSDEEAFGLIAAARKLSPMTDAQRIADVAHRNRTGKW